MKIKLCIFAILFTFIFSIHNFSYSDTTDIIVYQDKSFPFSVWHHKSWVNAQTSNPMTKFKVVSMNGEGSADFNINVVPDKKNSKKTAKGMVQYMVSNPQYIESLLKKAIPDVKLIDIGKTYLSNHDAYYTLAEGTYNYATGNTYFCSIYQISTYIDNTAYILTFRCPVKEFESYIETFKSMASSFVVTPQIN